MASLYTVVEQQILTNAVYNEKYLFSQVTFRIFCPISNKLGFSWHSL